MEEKEIMKQKLKNNLLEKDQFDRKKVDITDGSLSLTQFMSTKKRIENIKIFKFIFVKAKLT